ncbi:MAG: hypothetical protein LH650_02830 [Chloroflexi bacterium]|nr:hypothetical protein [Chloroflexota bacterium]
MSKTGEDLQLVAKRTRGVTPTSAYRPGQAPVKKGLAATSSQRPGTQPPAAIPGAAPRPSDLDASIVLADAPPAAVAAASPRAPVVSHQRGHIKMKPNSLLAARASQEYVYVGEDLRHIAVVAGVLLAALSLLWLVIVVLNVFGIY